MAVIYFFPPAGEVIKCKRVLKDVLYWEMWRTKTSIWESKPDFHFTVPSLCAGQMQSVAASPTAPTAVAA